MKILLVAVNAKYIHSNLAVYSLRAYADDPAVEIAEYTINQQLDDILMDIYRRSPDVLCFSCYIWNLDDIEVLVREMGKLRPGLPIWLGGPEVSYDAADVLGRLPQVKGVMKGEGEETFASLCRIYHPQEEDNAIASVDCALAEVDGITFRREDGGIVENPWRPVMDLSRVPFVYHHMEDFEHKIVYYETSRGCPFSCSYCLSSVDKKLRFRDLELVKRELQFFLDHKVPQVKFVDRTFNCRHDHSIAIWNYILEHDNGITNFHFEVAADLLNEEELQILEQMRPGLVQLEIGVQSTNPDTIRAIRRTMNFEKVSEVVRRVQNMGNIHQHLDLIAGLPYEDIASFARSFDDVYALKPEQLQLGFLKVLKGSYMEEHQRDYGLVHKDRPPYEVLYTKWLSYEDVMRLKGIEEMVEVYYNSRQFTHTMDALEQEYDSAYELYDRLSDFYAEKGYGSIQHKRSARYAILLEYIAKYFPKREEYYREKLTYDYYLRENAKSRPEFAGEYRVPKEVARAFYENEENCRKYLPGYGAYDRNQMRKMTHLEYFTLEDEYILFDYMERNPLNQEARVCRLGQI
ncbi:MAG: B12-binding domain-containing radical SAM protein [Dorea sp.]